MEILDPAFIALASSAVGGSGPSFMPAASWFLIERPALGMKKAICNGAPAEWHAERSRLIGAITHYITERRTLVALALGLNLPGRTV